MDTSTRATAEQQIADARERIGRFDAIQNEIDKLQAVKDGGLYRANLIAETNDAVAVTDAEIITKAGVVLDRLIAEKVAEQKAI